MTYEIDDAKKRASQYPTTFERPCDADIEAKLRPSTYAKMLFQCTEGTEKHAERMWVRVLRKEGHRWVGELANRPITIPPELLSMGDTVYFEARHVADIVEEE